MNEHDIAAIVTKFQEGDTAALKSIYDMLFFPLCYFSERLVENKGQAEDIATEAFIKLWKRHDQFYSFEKVKAFLYITVRNASLDHLKHIQRKTASHKEILYLAEKDDDFLQSGIIKSELLRKIYELIDTLPEKYRNVLRLIYIEGLSHAEAADKLGLPPENIRVQKARGLELLRVAVLKRKLLMAVA